MSCYVYGLIDPTTKEMRYIGYAHNLIKRLSAHINKSVSTNNKHKRLTHKEAWIIGLLIQNKKPEIIKLEDCRDDYDAKQAEIELIEYYKYIGCNLTNKTIGGDGIRKGSKIGPCSNERRKNISLSKIGKPRTYPVWNKGQKYTKEQKETNGVRKLTDEQIIQIRNDERPSRQIGKEYNISHVHVLRIRNLKARNDVI